jgi:hypothetical protein
MGLGVLALALILPVLLYTWLYLGDASPESGARAMAILVHERIPFHSLPEVWLNKTAFVQMGLMTAGLILAWRTRLFPVMALLALGGAAFTLVQMTTHSDSLAMIAPWRVSVLLVPLATALVLDRTVTLLLAGLEKLKLPAAPVLGLAALALAAYCVYRGVEFQQLKIENYRFQKVAQAFNYVKLHKQSGEIYLVPPTDSEFDDFRLFTGAPTYITWKSHPYRDTEVLEWYRRVQQAKQFYESPDDQACRLLGDLAGSEGITHVVFKGKTTDFQCPLVVEEARMNRFIIYRVRLP